MAEENQVTTKEVEAGRRLAEEDQVTTKNPSKVAVDKSNLLAEYNHRKREESTEESSRTYANFRHWSCFNCGWSWLLCSPSQGQQHCTSTTP